MSNRAEARTRFIPVISGRSAHQEHREYHPAMFCTHFLVGRHIRMLTDSVQSSLQTGTSSGESAV